jgi:hypothetical protein
MRTRRRNSRRLVQRTRPVVRPRALEDPGFDELDEWMVACPAGETPQIAD